MFILRKQLRDTCTAHYLGKGYPKACKNAHGHNYFYTVEVGGEKLNQYDMLIDFSDIKSCCDTWLQENWDHTTIFSSFQTEAKELWEKMGWKFFEFPIKDVNTTAEHMSEFLAQLFYKKLKELYPNIEYVQVEVSETKDSTAIYKVDISNFDPEMVKIF